MAHYHYRDHSKRRHAMTSPAYRAKDIFLEAVEIGPPNERAAFLEQVCAGDAGLRHRVEALLKAHERPESLLDRAAAVIQPGTLMYAAGSPAGPIEGPGAVLGPYKLVERIGEGGMGVVFRAEQAEPVRREVALKLIRPGMDTEQVLARFGAERQALELMEHPNIARVLDAGATPAGRPYFVMELVRGVPITRYCDDARLAPRERLELFAAVCTAVQHAHQKGIIHRDIKPSNILVTEVDGKPVPKVIDFGVAKAIDQQRAERTLFTQHGAIVGTPEYMSPEQAGAAPDIDTRTDVYSLGVLLYELLTGTTPLDREMLRRAALDEVLRQVREAEPPKPSTRLSGSGDRLPSVAAVRRTEPARLARLVRGDLDWVAMKALEKDRARRYETAAALAADVRRHLDGDPVEAGPPSRAYRLRKFARKHRAALATVGAFALLLIAAAAVSTWLAFRAHAAERTALKAEAVMRDQRDRAVAAESEARRQAAISRAVNEFLTEDLLGETAPDRNRRDHRVTVEELLGRASAKVADRFADQPVLEAAIRQTMGNTYQKLGNYPEAQPHYERSLELRRRALGPEHPDTLIALHNLAILFLSRSRFADAEPLIAQELEVRRRVLGPEHPGMLASMNSLAALYRALGQYDRAELLFVQIVEISPRVNGPDHPDTLMTMNNLASLYYSRGRYAEAEPLFTRSLESQRRSLGPEHPQTLLTMNNLGAVYRNQGRYAEAEPLLNRALAAERGALGPEHPQTLLTTYNLAELYRRQGRYAEAEPLFITVVEVERRMHGPPHPDVGWTRSALAELYLSQRRYAEAEGLHREVLTEQRKRMPSDSPDLAATMAQLGMALLHQRKWSEAEAILRECLKIREAKLPDDWSRFNTMSQLGGSLLGQGRYAEAEPLIVQGFEGLKAREPKIPSPAKSRLSEAAERVVALYEDWNRPDHAAAWKAKLGLADFPADVFARP
jgi:serine/threonine protein kinase/tetratricopeptide (TPR) repeat protein